MNLEHLQDHNSNANPNPDPTFKVGLKPSPAISFGFAHVVAADVPEWMLSSLLISKMT